jgi:hypothetical protein
MALDFWGPDIVTATSVTAHDFCQQLLMRSWGVGSSAVGPGGVAVMPSSLTMAAQHAMIAHDLFLALAIVVKYRMLLPVGDETAHPSGVYSAQQLEKRWLRERHATSAGGRFDRLAYAVLQGDFTETFICQPVAVAARGLHGSREHDRPGPGGTPWVLYVNRDMALFRNYVVNVLRGFMAAARDGTAGERATLAAVLGVDACAVQATLDAKLLDFIAHCEI